jgi:hypothetical protein
MGTGSFPGVQRPGRGVDHPLSSNAEVKERVELYLYSPLGSHGMFQSELDIYVYLNVLETVQYFTKKVYTCTNKISPCISGSYRRFGTTYLVPFSRVKQYCCVTPQVSPKRRRKPEITHVPTFKTHTKIKGMKDKTLGGKSRHKTTLDTILGN